MESLQPYEKTPIYRKAREILTNAHVVTARMNKSYKYTLGESIRMSALNLTECVFLAYEERDAIDRKLELIRSIKCFIQKLLINYRIASDLQLIARSVYAEQVELLINMLRQTKGWEAATSKASTQIS